MTTELPHMRCLGCGKVLSRKWEEYRDRVMGGEPHKSVSESLGFDRMCCKMWLMSPFKVPERAERDITEVAPRETLTTIAPPHKPMGALQALAKPTTVQGMAYTVSPDTDDIGLPGLPMIDLPPIIPEADDEEDEKETGKWYVAR